MGLVAYGGSSSGGAATKDLRCMSVIDGAAGKELLSVSIDDPKDFTYRCVYYE